MENTIVASIIAQGAGMLRSIGAGAIRLAQAIGIASAELVATSALTLGIGTAIALAAAAGGIAYLHSVTKGNDVVSPGYGKRTLFGPEGAIQLNNGDDVIAGTDLFKKGDDVAMAGKGALTVNSSPSKSQPDNSSLMLAELRENNRIRKEQMRKDKNVSTLRIQ
jgi:hypothetical protein